MVILTFHSEQFAILKENLMRKTLLRPFLQYNVPKIATLIIVIWFKTLFTDNCNLTRIITTLLRSFYVYWKHLEIAHSSLKVNSDLYRKPEDRNYRKNAFNTKPQRPVSTTAMKLTLTNNKRCPQKHDCIGYILELVLCKSTDLYLHEAHYVLADHRIHHSITGISAYIYTSNSSYPAGIVPSAVISYV